MIVSLFKSAMGLLCSLGIVMTNGVGGVIAVPIDEGAIMTSSKNMARCDPAVRRIMAERIQRGRSISYRLITHRHSDFNRIRRLPTSLANRPFGYGVTLTSTSDSAVWDVLSSHSLLRSVSQSIIEACPQISTVSFGPDRTTDGASEYGLLEDGRVVQFECWPSEDLESPIPWGAKFCT